MTRAELRRQQKAQQKLITMTAEAWQKGEFSLADVMKMLKDEVGVDFYERE